MFAASVLALTLASLATAAPVSSSTEEYVSTYISASDVWTSRFANATYTANATATVTVAETTVTVTYTPGVTSTSTSSWVAPSSTSDSYSSEVSSTSTWVPKSTSSSAEVVTSSAAVYEAAAVKSSSSSEAAWTPSTSEAAWTPSSSAAAPAATTQASSSQNSGDFSGTATYYYQNGAAGSCGDYHGDGDYIVAVNAPQVGGTCGKRVVITNTKNGNTATAVCADTCPGCAYGSLDLSSGLFAALGNGDMGQGVFPITWSFA